MASGRWMLRNRTSELCALDACPESLGARARAASEPAKNDLRSIEFLSYADGQPFNEAPAIVRPFSGPASHFCYKPQSLLRSRSVSGLCRESTIRGSRGEYI